MNYTFGKVNVGNYTLEQQYEMINEDSCNLRYIDNQYHEVCLQAVKK